jgi:hypothetical protein
MSSAPSSSVQSPGDVCSLGSAQSEMEAQAMGSKTMVELFLSSRRKRIEGTSMKAKSDGASAAFL